MTPTATATAKLQVTATVGGPDHCCKSSSARKFYSSSMRRLAATPGGAAASKERLWGAGMRVGSSVLLYKEGSAVW
jgi:hypothetical protein